VYPLPLTMKYESDISVRDLRSFVIRFDFEAYVRFVLMVRFESSSLSIVIRKETIGGG